MPPNDHAERLLRLEDDVGAIKTSTALTAQSLQQVVEKISDGFRAVNERLDRGAAQFDSHESRLDAQQARIVKVQDLEKARAGRWNTAKKAVLPLLLAAAGVLGTNFGTAAWLWITTLLGK